MYQRIRDLREDKDLNQTQIARMLGMSQTGYSKYETGENDIPTIVLIKLSNYYNVSIDYMLNCTNNPIRNKYCLFYKRLKNGSERPCLEPFIYVISEIN